MPASSVTTIKVSTATRDRIRDRGAATHEEAIVEALELAEERDFWAQAAHAAAWRAGLSDDRREALVTRERALDELFDNIS